MTNNDILIRLRYALDIKNPDMVEIFKLGGIDVAKEEVIKMLKNNKENDIKSDKEEDEVKCNNFMLESFLNGFIIFKRGKQESQPNQVEKPALVIKDSGSVNNVVLKKLKIALSLSSEDMIEILDIAGLTISKGELSAIFRKEGHRNYKECGDSYIKNFLKGLAVKHE